MNSNNKLISVKGRERPLSKKQKQAFLSLPKNAFDFSLFRDNNYLKKNKIFLEIGFGSGEIIFNEAKKSSDDYHQYAQQLGMIFRNQTQVLEQIINLLFYIAEADGEISKPEIQFIEGCAKYFGLQRNQYESIQSLWLDKQVNPYKILGVEKEATNEEIRKKWIQLSKELHPDQLRAQGVPQELIIKSEDRLSEINQAYDKIKILRNIN